MAPAMFSKPRSAIVLRDRRPWRRRRRLPSGGRTTMPYTSADRARLHRGLRTALVISALMWSVDDRSRRRRRHRFAVARTGRRRRGGRQLRRLADRACRPPDRRRALGILGEPPARLDVLLDRAGVGDRPRQRLGDRPPPRPIAVEVAARRTAGRAAAAPPRGCGRAPCRARSARARTRARPGSASGRWPAMADVGRGARCPRGDPGGRAPAHPACRGARAAPPAPRRAGRVRSAARRSPSRARCRPPTTRPRRRASETAAPRAATGAEADRRRPSSAASAGCAASGVPGSARSSSSALHSGS